MQRKNPIIQESIEDWAHALDLFSKATGLVLSLYTPDGDRVCGPFSSHALGNFFIQEGQFNEGALCFRYEQREVLKCVHDQKSIPFDLLGALRSLAMPLWSEGEIIGVFVAGWVFDHFTDPVECRRISEKLDIPENELWQISRLVAPTSEAKFNVYVEMLELLGATLTKQLESVQNLKTLSRLKDELLAVVSHELKTPLTSILLRIQMLRAHKVDPVKMTEFLSSLDTNAKIQSRLIDDLLDAARIITGKFSLEKSEVDISEILRQSVDMVREPAQLKKIAISTDGLKEHHNYLGDGTRLKQAFWNILSNSVKFTPQTGQISVSLKRSIHDYQIQITDTGPGIDKSFIPFLFNRFSQASTRHTKENTGLGLGLSLVKNIVDLHGGRIEVGQGPSGSGTIFEIYLPLFSTPALES